MIKKSDTWCDINWLIFLCVTSTVTAVCAAICWNAMPLGAKGSAVVAFIMSFHVLEEWKFPGGLHYLYNTLLTPRDESKRDPNRYPMSRFTDMLTNIGMQWIPLICLPISYMTGYSNTIAIGMMLFSFTEVLAHTCGGCMSLHLFGKKGKRTIYNPGFGTSYMMFLPAGAYIAANLQNTSACDWLGGVFLLVIDLVITIPLAEWPFRNWVNRQEKELFRFQNTKYFEKYTLADDGKPNDYCRE